MSTFAFSGADYFTMARPNMAEVIRLTNALPEVIAELWWTFTAGTTRVSNSILNVAPGQTVDLALSAAGGTFSYAIAAFGASGQMIARYPADYGTVYRFDDIAASMLSDSGIEPLVLDSTWAVSGQDSYRVTIVNLTPDTWDAVTLSFGSGQFGTVMLESEAIAPEKSISFDIAGAADLTGYCFAIWNNGLRAILGESSLQFPATGLMTPLRSAQESAKIDAHRCVWQIDPKPTP